VKKDRRD